MLPSSGGRCIGVLVALPPPPPPQHQAWEEGGGEGGGGGKKNVLWDKPDILAPTKECYQGRLEDTLSMLVTLLVEAAVPVEFVYPQRGEEKKSVGGGRGRKSGGD